MSSRCSSSGCALVIAFVAAVAVSRFRFRGRKSFIVMILVVQMIPAEAMIISLFKVLNGWQLTNTIIGLSLTYLVFVLPVHDLDAARLRRQRAA